MFNKTDARTEFLAAARVAREERALHERQIAAAIKIEVVYFNFLMCMLIN